MELSFQNRCLAAFRQQAHVGEDVKLTPYIIEDQYLTKWQDIMAYRIIACFKARAHWRFMALIGATLGNYHQWIWAKQSQVVRLIIFVQHTRDRMCLVCADTSYLNTFGIGKNVTYSIKFRVEHYSF